MATQVTCNNCGKDFNVTPSRFETRDFFFCCKKCEGEYRKVEPNMKCPICDKSFHIKPYRIKRLSNGEEVCCSKECSNIHKMERMLGENNHQYGLKGELNSSFKKDFKFSRYGYLLVRYVDHPFRGKDDFILFHRIIMEEFLKNNYPDSPYLVTVEGFGELLFLDKSIVVHHKNENKLDNRISNLKCMFKGEHTSYHNVIGKKKKVATTPLVKMDLDDAAQDIMSNENVTIPPKDSKLIKTNLFIAIPKNHVGLIWSRSGMSVKNKIEVGAGCIDSGYRGEVKVHLYNYGNNYFKVNKGDRIAQLLTIPINPYEYEEVDDLDETKRGSGGFGHSGT